MATEPSANPGHPAETRRTGSVVVFSIVLLGGLGVVFWLSPIIDVALAAGAAWIVLLLAMVAAGDLLAMASRRPHYLAWLPEWPLPHWLEALRASFVMVAFFYGIVVGHFFWR